MCTFRNWVTRNSGIAPAPTKTTSTTATASISVIRVIGLPQQQPAEPHSKKAVKRYAAIAVQARRRRHLTVRVIGDFPRVSRATLGQ